MSDPTPTPHPTPTSQTAEPSLDLNATAELQQALNSLRSALLTKAGQWAQGRIVTEDDIHRAYKELAFPTAESMQLADAQTVISQALNENRIIEFISYGMAIVLFVCGLLLFFLGVTYQDVGTRVGSLIGGSVVELLILIPFRFAINSRRHNIALRMLGLILNRVQDPHEVAPLLRDTFLAVVLGKATFRGPGAP